MHLAVNCPDQVRYHSCDGCLGDLGARILAKVRLPHWSSTATPQPLGPLAQHLHKYRVCPVADDFHKRTALFDGHPNRSCEKPQEDALILPAVQPPLVFPEPASGHGPGDAVPPSVVQLRQGR
jgi:hypothetical protein